MNIEDIGPDMTAEQRRAVGAHIEGVLNPRPTAPAPPSDDAVRAALEKSPAQMTAEDKAALRGGALAFLRESGRL